MPRRRKSKEMRSGCGVGASPWLEWRAGRAIDTRLEGVYPPDRGVILRGRLRRNPRNRRWRFPARPEFMTLSMVVPVRNEAENIDPLLAEIHAALDGRVDFEVVYVDDGSDDATADVLAAARARYP